MRIVRLLSLLIAFVLNASVVLAADLTSADLEKLGNYETKLFAHPFATDGVSARLDRIEDFVFGKTSDGSDSDRLASLVAAMGAAETDSPKKEEVATKPAPEEDSSKQSRQAKTSPPVVSDNSEDKNAAPGQNESASTDQPKPTGHKGKKNKELASAQTPTAAPPSPKDETPAAQPGRDPIETGEGFKKTDYPRVSKLELRMLGLTYDQDPLDERVDRLEIKAFKKPSSIDDLGQRIDNLEKILPPPRKIAYAPSSQDMSDDQYSAPPTSSRSKNHSDWDEGEGNIASAPPSTSYSYPDPYASPQSYSGADPYTWTNPNSSMNQMSGSGMSSGQTAYSQGAGAGIYSPPNSMSTVPRAIPVPRRQMNSLDKEAEQMEKEVLGKSYKKDALVDRLSRLEQTVFPGQEAPRGMTIPQRFQRLAEALGTGGGTRTATAGGEQSDWYNNNSNPNTSVLTNQEKKGFMSSLGKALGAVAGGAMSMNSMNSPYGYGGYSPYGGYGGYSPYSGFVGSPYYGGGYGGFNPYGYSNPYGGYSNFGSPYSGIGGFGRSPFGFGSPFGGSAFPGGTGFGGGGFGNGLRFR
jgi:hypothetical protein